jgi:hypothetical protein
MKNRPISAVQKKEDGSVIQVPGVHEGPFIFAEDLDGMGEAWFGLMEEEDTLFNMKEWEGKKRKKNIR